MEQFLSVTFEVKDFHLEHIFDCGQCFRWNRDVGGQTGADADRKTGADADRQTGADGGSWTGIAGGRVARMQLRKVLQDGGAAQHVLTITGIPLPEESGEDFARFWYEYLDLGRDYGKIKRTLGRGDAAMRRAIKAGSGIRILKQDLWETMVSFIISQNNNIPRIKGCIETLCREFGEPVHVPKSVFAMNRHTSAVEPSFGGETEVWYTMPGPEILAGLTREDLEVCRLGYRAPYLIETAKQVLERGGMAAVEEQLRQAEDVIGALTDFAGVGPKVASCIALFGAGRTDAFPIDVWMRRAMHTVYGIDEKDLRAMQAYAVEHFGRYGGYAQQYLFYYIRGLEG